MTQHSPTTRSVPVIALTAGEPAGIGPDLLAMIAQQTFDAQLVAIGDAECIQARSQQLGIDLTLAPYSPPAPNQQPMQHQAGTLPIIDIPCRSPVVAGELNVDNAQHVIDLLTLAAQGCLEHEFDAICTAPVHKGIINEAGIPFSGHTELFGELTQAHPVMMLVADELRVALATTHLPLRDVSQAITAECLNTVLRSLHHDLIHKYGIASPRILVCGLNPHAGEDGHLGREEIEVINPTLAALREEGLDLSDALPADTLFTAKHLDQADAVLAMYHDQGLPVLKHAGFGRAVNVTLGLPIIRTSVDHGTALDLAGTGHIHSGSFEAAIHEAIRMAAARAS